MGLVWSVLLVAGLLTAAACGADEGTPGPASTATAAPASTPTPAATTTVVAPPAATEPTSMPAETQALGPGAMLNTGPGKIAFVSTRDGNPEIYVINDDGSNMTRLTNHPTEDMHPTWSPDGSKLAFVALRDGNHEIYVIDADGSNMTRLTNHPTEDMHPTWSPDGSKLAFVALRDGNHEIYVIDADGSNMTRLTNSDQHEASGTRVYIIGKFGKELLLYCTGRPGPCQPRGAGPVRLAPSLRRLVLPWAPRRQR